MSLAFLKDTSRLLMEMSFPLVLSLPPWSRHQLAFAGFSVDSAVD